MSTGLITESEMPPNTLEKILTRNNMKILTRIQTHGHTWFVAENPLYYG